MQTLADALPVRSAQQVPHAPDRCIGKARRGIFASIMSALHTSRCLQARRILRQINI